ARGTRRHQQTKKPVVTVYPRWRGEHSPAELNKINADGLSPLARGTPPGGLHQRGLQRFIPAGAGNTPAATISRPLMPVYPRWRGEHRYALHSCHAGSGLSPLARGTH
ncbi:hypothetical protein SEEM41H_03629, partial [Salmonella enterica subsp. enterica serovar Montevideo str. 4441 H]